MILYWSNSLNIKKKKKEKYKNERYQNPANEL